MRRESKSVDNHGIKQSNSEAEQSVMSSPIEVFDLTPEHLRYLGVKKQRSWWMVVLLMIIPLEFLILSTLDWFPLKDRFIFFGTIIVSVLIGVYGLHKLFRLFLKIPFFYNMRGGVVLAIHKHSDSDWYNPAIYAPYVGIPPGFFILYTFAVGGVQLLSNLQEHPYLITPLLRPITVLVFISAVYILIGDVYPYATAFYQVRKWYEIKRREETPDVKLLINAFCDLERHFSLDGLSFGKFGGKLIEEILLLARFGSTEDEEQFCNDIAALLERMQNLDELKFQKYRSTLSIIKKMNKNLEKQDIEELIQRKIPRLEKLKNYLLNPDFLGPLIVVILSVILPAILTMFVK